MSGLPPLGGASLEPLLATKEIIVCCGSGGVGKTTTAAAAAAMAAASLGGKVLVLTVDPARRLANALGMEELGNVERPVAVEAFREAGVDPRGELWAAMLDTKQSWDELVRRHAPDANIARRILDNPLYENVAGRFVQSHEYIAMERLYEIHRSGVYDLIVVDTPPARNAVDFLEAPERMAEFFSSRLVRWLTVPARSRMGSFAARPFYQVADRVLGSQFLQDVAEFFMLFQTMYDGFLERARAVKRLLRDRRTSFVVVSTLESAPLRDAEYFIEALRDHRVHLGAVVLNKILPDYFRDPGAAAVAERLHAQSAAVAHGVVQAVSDGDGDGDGDGGSDGGSPDEEALTRVLNVVGESFLNFLVVATRESEQRAELSAVPEAAVVAVPYLETDVFDLAGVLRIGRAMWGAPATAPVAARP